MTGDRIGAPLKCRELSSRSSERRSHTNKLDVKERDAPLQLVDTCASTFHVEPQLFDTLLGLDVVQLQQRLPLPDSIADADHHAANRHGPRQPKRCDVARSDEAGIT